MIPEYPVVDKYFTINYLEFWSVANLQQQEGRFVV